MKSVGIVAEYNPFHLGHEYNIQKAREAAGEDAAVVAVMSGDFVQRGEAALFNKYTRAHAASLCGADVVIELPIPWSVSTAEIFARGAVGIMKSIGITDICFGAETDDITILQTAEETISSESFNAQLKELITCNRSVSYAEQRETLLKSFLGDSIGVLAQPNNILGIEYLKALRLYNSPIKPHCIKRSGNGHDAKGEEGFRSASEIREQIRRGLDFEGLVPNAAYSVYTKDITEGLMHRNDDSMVLSRLLMLSSDDFCTMAYCSGGMGEALFKAVHSSSSLNEIIEKVTCKTFTRARVRRALLSCVLKNTVEPGISVPPYARILSCTPAGRQWLKEKRGDTEIPLITKSADLRSLCDKDRLIAEITADAHDFYTLGYINRKKYIPGEDWITRTVII